MEKNEIVKIRNSAGILDVQLLEKMNNMDVFRGFDERLKFKGTVRWEFHEKNGVYMITLFDREPDNTKMIIAFLMYGELEFWEAQILGTEKDENIYTLMQGE